MLVDKAHACMPATLSRMSCAPSSTAHASYNMGADVLMAFLTALGSSLQVQQLLQDTTTLLPAFFGVVDIYLRVACLPSLFDTQI